MGIKLKNFHFTAHALFEMKRRGITREEVIMILSSPDQAIEVEAGRVVLQSLIKRGDPSQAYLLRVFVDIDRQPAEIVTAYLTSKINKYWGENDESNL